MIDAQAPLVAIRSSARVQALRAAHPFCCSDKREAQMRSVLATVILSAATAASGFAHAEVAGNRVVVQRGDLDLDDPFDARTMVQRIDAAASRACGGNPRFYLDYRLHRPLLIEQYEACRDAAVSDALAQLNSPEVTRAYARFGEAGQG